MSDDVVVHWERKDISLNEVESILLIVFVLWKFYPEAAGFADALRCFAGLLLVAFCSREGEELLEDGGFDAEDGVVVEEVGQFQERIGDDFLLVECLEGQLIEVAR